MLLPEASCLLLAAGLTLAMTATPLDIKTCADDQPDVVECRRNALQEAIPLLAAGIPQINAAPVDPMVELKPLTWQTNSRGLSVKFRLDHAKITGLGRAIVDALEVDTDKNLIHIVSHIDGFNTEGTYTMSGEVLGVPVDGSGFLKQTVRSASVDVRCAGHLENGDGGQRFLIIDSVTVKMQPGDSHFELTGIFGNYQPLVSAGNKFINAIAWNAVQPEMLPTLEKWFAEEFRQRAQAVFSTVPYNVLFPKTSAYSAIPQYSWSGREGSKWSETLVQ